VQSRAQRRIGRPLVVEADAGQGTDTRRHVAAPRVGNSAHKAIGIVFSVLNAVHSALSER
jgi:hypothetical protein